MTAQLIALGDGDTDIYIRADQVAALYADDEGETRVILINGVTLTTSTAAADVAELVANGPTPEPPKRRSRAKAADKGEPAGGEQS